MEKHLEQKEEGLEDINMLTEDVFLSLVKRDHIENIGDINGYDIAITSLFK